MSKQRRSRERAREYMTIAARETSADNGVSISGLQPALHCTRLLRLSTLWQCLDRSAPASLVRRHHSSESPLFGARALSARPLGARDRTPLHRSKDRGVPSPAAHSFHYLQRGNSSERVRARAVVALVSAFTLRVPSPRLPFHTLRLASPRGYSICSMTACCSFIDQNMQQMS